MHNLGQNESNLLADHTNTKIMIVPAINTDLLGRQYNMVMQPTAQSSEQFLYYKNISFRNFLLSNWKGLAYPSNKVVQNN